MYFFLTLSHKSNSIPLKMTFPKKVIFIFLAFFFSIVSHGNDSIRISLITCEPHEQVYSLYGHTAIRIQDLRNGTDISVNYGVFDTSKGMFVARFVLGLTDYTAEAYPTDLFLREYEYYGSAVYEQVLNLTDEETSNIVAALNTNLQPENKIYRYNFFFNNCTTKARDIILSNISGSINFKENDRLREHNTFRKLIHWKNDQYPWCKFGNDMLLGVGSDRQTTQAEGEFLPEILMMDFDNATITDKNGSIRKLVSEKIILLPHAPSMAPPMSSFLLNPFGISAIILALCLMVFGMEIIQKRHRIAMFDNVLFTLYGIVGILLTIMLFSEHPTVRLNGQLLLFSPILLLYVFFKRIRKRMYFITIASLFLFFVISFIQDYAEGVTILALSLLVRLASIAYFNKKTHQNVQLK